MFFLNKNLISIDIGSSCVKLIEVTGGSKKVVKSTGIEVLEQGVVVNGRVEDSTALIAALTRLTKRMKKYPQRVGVVLWLWVVTRFW